jgi:hypothetical protein
MKPRRTAHNFFLTLVAALAWWAGSAAAQDLTDMWWNPSESGWGINVVQSNNGSAGDTLWITFFVYGSDRKATWYTAYIAWDGSKYTGPLYSSVGSYFASGWNPSEQSTTAVGTATFQPSTLNAYQATLTYTISGIGTVVKAIERQTLGPITLAGSYVIAQTGTYANCNNSANNGPYTDTGTATVTHTISNNFVTISARYDSNATCTLQGTAQRTGQLFRIPGATYSCTGDLTVNTTGTLYELKQTGQGFEGRFAATHSNGCQESAAFTGVLR